MTYRAKQILKAIHHDEPMDTDSDSIILSTKHQLILQYLMHARMARKEELSKMHRKLFSDDERLNDSLSAITKCINPLKMDIKHIKCDVTGATYYVLIHSTGESFFPRCCVFSKSQLMFLKQVLTGIVLSVNGSIGKIQALNSCTVLTKSEADETIEKFIKEQILIETSRGDLCLSPLAVVEFELYFTRCLSDNLFNCDLCKQLVFVGKICNSCHQKFHFHCVNKWFDGKRLACPKCQQIWTHDMEADSD